ncbi:MAG TPA: molybdenum cofactor guanylyltransferase [Pyrinomonadaceae bacterium]|jgi:molybdopterin-guanine dinucleotide biosynthesis protein A
MLKIDGYVLVGGKSSRMGTNKFALSLCGATFAELAVHALRKIAESRVYFVTGANQKDETAELLPLDVPRIADVLPHKAAIGGIYTALRHSKSDSKSEWIAVLACDYPFVSEDLFVRLTETAESIDANVSAIAPLQADGRVQPLCALYRVDPCLKIAGRLLQNDKIPAVRALLENTSTHLVDFKQLADLPGADNFFTNVNTPDDFLRIQNRIDND